MRGWTDRMRRPLFLSSPASPTLRNAPLLGDPLIDLVGALQCRTLGESVGVVANVFAAIEHPETKHPSHRRTDDNVRHRELIAQEIRPIRQSLLQRCTKGSDTCLSRFVLPFRKPEPCRQAR